MKSIPQLKYQTALGISTGDQVRTSYGTGGVVTHISAPHFVDEEVGRKIIHTCPVVSVMLDGDKVINGIRQEGERWFTDANDEVFFTRRQGEVEQQIDMFASAMEMPKPYSFQTGVDYTHNVWTCGSCGDFNAEGESDMRWRCPRCGEYGVKQITLHAGALMPLSCNGDDQNDVE